MGLRSRTRPQQLAPGDPQEAEGDLPATLEAHYEQHADRSHTPAVRPPAGAAPAVPGRPAGSVTRRTSPVTITLHPVWATGVEVVGLVDHYRALTVTGALMAGDDHLPVVERMVHRPNDRQRVAGEHDAADRDAA
jgi:hypothetical protein